jgi:hypothetical protein
MIDRAKPRVAGSVRAGQQWYWFDREAFEDEWSAWLAAQRLVEQASEQAAS